MKTARTLAQELIGYIDPPRGTAIVVNEAPSMRPEDPNWIIPPAIMDPMRAQRLAEKAAELRKSYPLIDWSDGDGSPGVRRVAMWGEEKDKEEKGRCDPSGEQSTGSTQTVVPVPPG
jgi:hypothetical protein